MISYVPVHPPAGFAGHVAAVYPSTVRYGVTIVPPALGAAAMREKRAAKMRVFIRFTRFGLKRGWFKRGAGKKT
jgi:hypothetical protein